MNSKVETLSNKSNDIQALFDKYPVLEKIDKKNNGIISEHAYFKNLYAEEYISGADEICHGILFVLEGIINIQKININGEQTNLYNINQGGCI